MSSAKKRRELNRAASEYDRKRISAEIAISRHTMRDIFESIARKEIERLTQQRDELLATLEAQQIETVCECKNCMRASAAISRVKGG